MPFRVAEPRVHFRDTTPMQHQKPRWRVWSKIWAVALRPDGIRVNCVAPGFVLTEMHERTMEAGADQVGQDYFARTARALASDEGDSPDLAANLVSFLLSPESVSVTGKLISARWDAWQDEVFRARLASDPDFATLRRIDGQFFTKLNSDASAS